MIDVGRFRDGLRRWDKCLRLDRLDRQSDRVRARLVYSVGLFFIVMQLINMVALHSVYGEFNSQHVVALVVCIVLAGMIALLRVTVNARVYAAISGGLVLGGILSAAMTTPYPIINGGISTPIMPVMVAGAALVGWMGSRLSAAIYLVLAVSMLVLMAGQSTQMLANADYDTALNQALSANISRRLTQSIIAVVSTGVVSAGIGYWFYRLLDTLEGAARQARQAEALKSAFHANMNHEIRSPLNGIIGMSDVLLRGELDDRQRQCATLVRDAGRSLNHIIDEVLDIAKLEEGLLALHPEPMDLHATLQDIVALHRASASAEGLWLGLDWADGLPHHVVGDPNRLRQVVGNLVGNALKFTKAGGVRIGVRGATHPTATRARIQIFVQDTGVGIATEDQAAIFDRYAQSDAGRRMGSQGTGLGLSIASDIVELMGGQLSVASEPGRGSTFHFTLDLDLVGGGALEGAAA